MEVTWLDGSDYVSSVVISNSGGVADVEGVSCDYCCAVSSDCCVYSGAGVG